MLDIEFIREHHTGLYDALRERVTDESMSDDARDAELLEWCKTHTPAEALAEWSGWELGDPRWASSFLSNMWLLLQASTEYMTTTDRDREEWLVSLLGVRS